MILGVVQIKPLKKTKTGAACVDASVLEKCRHIKPKAKRIFDLIEEVRKMRKMKSTYLTGHKKLVDDNDRLHTSYLTTGTVTGRPSSSAPNLQNIPTDPEFRSLFISGPGRKLIVADYSQIEARLVAFLAGETKLIIKFRDPNFDIHTYVPCQILNIPENNYTKEQRTHDKAITFGITYGRSAYSIAQEYDMDIHEVEDFIEGYFTTYSKIAAFRQNNIKIAHTDFELRNRIGRIRHFPVYKWLLEEHNPDMKQMLKLEEKHLPESKHGRRNFVLMMLEEGADRMAINFPMQSYANDLFKRAIDKVRKEYRRRELDAFVMLDIHDCLISDVDDDDAEECLDIVKTLMPITKRLRGHTMKFTVNAEIADHWV